jgi:predicted nucleic acid-binding protein
MRRYTQPRRAQMDFADATLVWAAGETGIRQIWTLDVRDFYRYRLPDGGAFDIL